MPERTISTGARVIVWIVLLLLTILNVSVSFFPIAGIWHLVVGLVIAACQAALVVLFSMNVMLSSRLTWIVILVTCFWVGIQLVLTLTDYFTRGMVPYMPGH